MTNKSLALQEIQTLTISQVSERTGLSRDTLRYYEKVGLIELIGRNAGNHRCYAVTDLDWLEFLLRLRETGMSIEGMRQYAQLRSTGTKTLGERLGILREHRSSLENHIRSLRQSAKAVEDKIDHYEALLAEQGRNRS